MDVGRVRLFLEEASIRCDRPHFTRRAEERDRCAEYLIGQLKSGNIEAVRQNPNPAGSVPYDRALLVDVPARADHRYRIATYLRQSGTVLLKTVFRVRDRRG